MCSRETLAPKREAWAQEGKEAQQGCGLRPAPGSASAPGDGRWSMSDGSVVPLALGSWILGAHTSQTLPEGVPSRTYTLSRISGQSGSLK